VVAVLVRARSDSFWLFALLLVWLLARWVVRLTLRRLRVTHDIDRDHLFPGERVTFTLRVRNGSPLPAPWVWVRDHVPAALLHGPAFSHVATLAPGAEQVHRYQVQATQRGLYRVGHIEVSLGDWFGLRELGGTMDEERWLTVYPRISSAPLLRLPARIPTGPRRDPSSPFQDVQPMGVRRYLPGDPLRLIAWKATARRGELMVKEQPLVRERVTVYFLDLVRGDWDASGRFELMERALTVAASLVWWEADSRHSLGLVAYGQVVRAVPEGIGREVEEPGILRIAARPGSAHRRAILEALAGLQPADGPAFVDWFQAEAGALPWGATIVVLAPTNSHALVESAALLQRRGHPVVMLVFEPRRTMRAPFPVYEVEAAGAEVRLA
jgi:uncharacterized protein (DUF58 family)